MNDLISRKALLNEILLIEKELLRDKEDARNSDDEQMLFAIDNQMNALWRARCKINNQHIAYDVEKVVEQLESFPKLEVTQFPLHGSYLKKDTVMRIVKGGGVDVL